MEKAKLQQKTYLWNLLLVVLGGVLTIAGGIANTERLSRLESKKQEYNRFWRILAPEGKPALGNVPIIEAK